MMKTLDNIDQSEFARLASGERAGKAA